MAGTQGEPTLTLTLTLSISLTLSRSHNTTLGQSQCRILSSLLEVPDNSSDVDGSVVDSSVVDLDRSKSTDMEKTLRQRVQETRQLHDSLVDLFQEQRCRVQTKATQLESEWSHVMYDEPLDFSAFLLLCTEEEEEEDATRRVLDLDASSSLADLLAEPWSYWKEVSEWVAWWVGGSLALARWFARSLVRSYNSYV